MCAPVARAEVAQVGGGASWRLASDDERDSVDVSAHAASTENRVRRSTEGGWRLARVYTAYICALDENTGEVRPVYVWTGPDGEYVESCHESAAPRPIPKALAAETADEMVLPLGGVQMNPAEGQDQMVNLPVWLWLDNWEPVSTSATLRGVTVTVTATPSSVTWDMGDGEAPVVCGPGRAYDRDRPEREQSTDCSYSYTRSSFGQQDERFHGSATVDWAIVWTSNAGTTGTLADIHTSRPFTMRVTEGEAVVTEAR
jgi:hypothetical protein